LSKELTLRDKAVIISELGFFAIYFNLLLKQHSITKQDKEFIEKLWLEIK